jgi:hypothetical protein
MIPQKRAATPVIDFVRTTTLIKYLWTLRLMLEVGALVPFDGTENEVDASVQEQIEQELVDDAQATIPDSRREAKAAKSLQKHPDVVRSTKLCQCAVNSRPRALQVRC